MGRNLCSFLKKKTMQCKTSFQLILNDKNYIIPSSFPSLQDVNPDIYQMLIKYYQYKVKSNVYESVFAEFLDNWIKNKTPNIDYYNIYDFEKLSEEFDRMKDIVQLCKINIQKLENINFYYYAKKNEAKILKRMKYNYLFVLKSFFNNIEQINKNCHVQINPKLITKNEFESICKSNSVKSVKLFSKQMINVDGIAYILDKNDNTAELYNIVEDNENIIIPKSIIYQFQEYIVTKIGSCIINYGFSIKTVNFPKDSQLKIIGKRAFYNSTIQSISIPSTVIKISRKAFFYCKNLTNVEIPKNSELTHIGSSAFSNSSISNIFIPKKVKSIEPACFSGCANLQKVIFSEQSQLQIIKSNAFAYSGIEKVLLPSNLAILKKKCFYSCPNLQEIDLCENSKLNFIEEEVFSLSSIKNLTIPSSIIELRHGWCSSTNNLNNIKILQNKKKRIKCIDNNVIIGRTNPKIDKYDCILFAPRNIEEVKIPSSIKRISSYAFQECKKLKKVSFMKNSKLEIIDDYSFCNCSFKEITIPSNVIAIEKRSFSMEKLQKVTFLKESQLKSIGVKAFSNSSLAKIKIPSSVLFIGKKAFSSCQNFSIFEFEKNSKLEIIDKKAFSKTALKNISIPSHVKTINEYVFNECLQLQKVVFLEKSEIKQIYSISFIGSSLTEFTIPSSVEEYEEDIYQDSNIINLKIDPKNNHFKMYKNELILTKSNKENDIFDVIFWASKNIKKVIIPSFIKKIDNSAFQKCKLLEIVEFLEDSQLVEIGNKSFYETPIQSIIIPKHVKSIGFRAFHGCNNLKSVKFYEDSELECIDFSAFSFTSIECFKFPSHVDYIVDSIFDGCKRLKTIEFSENSIITKIKSFLKDTSVETISIPSNVVKFSNYWSQGLLNLKNIIFNNNKNFIYYDNEFILGKSDPNNDVFDILHFANDRKQIVIPSFIKIIEACAFLICYSLKKLVFLKDSQLTDIRKKAFYESSIECISIPKHVKKIGKSAFVYSKIKFIDFEDDCELEFIGFDAFSNSHITCLYIPSNVKIIERCTFFDCRQLQIIEIAENSKLTSLNSNEFMDSKCIMIPPKISKKLFQSKKTYFFD